MKKILSILLASALAAAALPASAEIVVIVNKDNPASRDEPLVIYATGLGVTTGGRATTGTPAPSNPLAVTVPVQVQP